MYDPAVVAIDTPSTQNKAVALNRDATIYGTFAEIGAGQEVARWFFHVGGAAGTVAKTISAYDMQMSDAIYGPSDRYVSRKRLQAMLAYEFDLLVQRLDAKRGATDTFFVFADTVAASSYLRHDEGQGWMGIRFQTAPRSAPSEIVLHVRMLDRENSRQQAALGVLGVNLIHSAFHLHATPVTLLSALMDDLGCERIEIDLIKFSGPAFAAVDNRLMSLELVTRGFTDTAMFTPAGEVVQPAELLYKQPILIERGSFRPITNVTLDLLECAAAQFRAEPVLAGAEPVVLMEMTLQDLEAEKDIDHRDFLDRVDILRVLDKTVLISNHRRDFRLMDQLFSYQPTMVGLALGVPNLAEIVDESYYADVPGGVLEAAGRLFREGVKVYVYPWKDPVSQRLTTVETMEVSPNLRHLHAHLLQNRCLEPIRGYTDAFLSIVPRDVLAKLQSGDPAWETMVPPVIVETIKRDHLFGYR